MFHEVPHVCLTLCKIQLVAGHAKLVKSQFDCSWVELGWRTMVKLKLYHELARPNWEILKLNDNEPKARQIGKLQELIIPEMELSTDSLRETVLHEHQHFMHGIVIAWIAPAVDRCYEWICFKMSIVALAFDGMVFEIQALLHLFAHLAFMCNVSNILLCWQTKWFGFDGFWETHWKSWRFVNLNMKT